MLCLKKWSRLPHDWGMISVWLIGSEPPFGVQMSLPSFILDPICVTALDHEIKDGSYIHCRLWIPHPKLFLPFSFHKCNTSVTWAAARPELQRPEPSLGWQSGFVLQLVLSPSADLTSNKSKNKKILWSLMNAAFIPVCSSKLDQLLKKFPLLIQWEDLWPAPARTAISLHHSVAPRAPD